MKLGKRGLERDYLVVTSEFFIKTSSKHSIAQRHVFDEDIECNIT
jgi:hypothetical protein